MKKIWVNKVNSFKAAKNFENDYYLKMGPLKRLEAMQLLREWYFKIKRGQKKKTFVKKAKLFSSDMSH